MNSSTITIKTNQKTKQEAQDVAKKLGKSIDAILNGYLQYFVETKKEAPLVVKESSHEGLTPTPYLKKILLESEKNREKGKSSPSFTSAKDAISFLHKQSK